MNDKCTIYKLINKITGKLYIGQTWCAFSKRWDNGNGYYKSPLLYKSIQKHGKENFYYDILTTCDTQDEADFLEDYYIILFDTRNLSKGYNLKEGGSQGKLAEETKLKISEAQKGEKNHRFGKPAPNKGITKIFTNEQELKIKELYITGEYSITKLTNLYSVSKETIYNVFNRHGIMQLEKFIKMATRTLTNDQIIEIITLYGSGSFTTYELGDKFGVHSTTIQKIVKNCKKKDRRKSTLDQRAEVYKLYLKGNTQQKISITVNLSQATVNRIIKTYQNSVYQ